jgi:Emfourin
MKVQFTQSGGFAGAIRHCTLETDTMKPDEAAALEALVRQANLSSSREHVTASGRDLEEYQISVDDGGKSLTVVHDQSTLPAAAKALVGYLKKCARPGMPK